jgi:hypothetical protein
LFFVASCGVTNNESGRFKVHFDTCTELETNYLEDQYVSKDSLIEEPTVIVYSNPNYDKNYIFSVDVAEKSVKYKKTSHLRYDIFLKPKNKLRLEEHRDILKSISDILDEKLIEMFRRYNLKWT